MTPLIRHYIVAVLKLIMSWLEILLHNLFSNCLHKNKGTKSPQIQNNFDCFKVGNNQEEETVKMGSIVIFPFFLMFLWLYNQILTRDVDFVWYKLLTEDIKQLKITVP